MIRCGVFARTMYADNPVQGTKTVLYRYSLFRAQVFIDMHSKINKIDIHSLAPIYAALVTQNMLVDFELV